MKTITLIEDSRRQGCGGGCGTDWTLPESREAAKVRLRERFGGEPEIVFIDLAGDASHPLAGEWSEKAERSNLTLPLLIVGGELRISGNFDLRQLCDILEVEMELEA